MITTYIMKGKTLSKIVTKNNFKEIIEEVCKNNDRRDAYRNISLEQLEAHMYILNKLNTIAWYYFNGLDWAELAEESEKLVMDFYEKYDEVVKVVI